MKVIVDAERCALHGECVRAAPTVFAIDEDDVVMVLEPNPGEELRSTVEDAAMVCPMAAIRIED